MTSNLDNRISRLTGEFKSPSLERRFRAAAAAEWHSQIRVASLVAALVVLAAGIPDFLVGNSVANLSLVFILRAVVAGALFANVYAIWRGSDFETVDKVLFFSLLVATGFAAAVINVRAESFGFSVLPTFILVPLVYLGFPNRSLFVFLNAAFISTVYFAGVTFSQLEPSVDINFVMIIFAANVFGLFVRARLQSHERNQFLAVEALRDGETRLRTVFQQAPDGIVMVDPAGTIESANRAFLDLFRYTEPEIIGKSILSLAPQEWRRLLGRLLKDVGQGREIWENSKNEAVGLRSDGSTFPFEFAVASMELPNEQMVAAFVRDLTELKKVDRIQSEFISTVSHELRTPLTSIKGSLGLIRTGSMGEVGEKIIPLVDIAYNNSDRLTRLINDILDLEKIQAGMMDFKMEPLDLAKVVPQAVAANQGFGDQYGISFVVTSSVNTANILGDHDRIWQVMANLLSNAAKFSPEGASVDISISRGGPGFRVTVADHGSGMAEEFQSTIFERFTQADQSDSRRVGGTGLGLNICKSIVDHHQGTIGFETKLGSGSTFYFDLPERLDPE